ncbi:helix-turn-helix domain-containing protein [Paenibacillus marinisediminis]
MGMEIYTSFKRANAMLNRSMLQLSAPDLSLRIHFWGFMPEHYDNARHRHSFLEACYVMSGHGTYTEGTETYEIKPGTSFISRPGIWHQIKSESGLAICYVAFEPDESVCSDYYLNGYQLLMNHEKTIISDVSNHTTGALWNALVGMFNEPYSYPPMAIQSTALSLLLSFIPNHSAHTKESEAAQTVHASVALFNQAKLFIDDNLSEPLSLKLVASHLNISPRHLTRLFTQYQRQSFVHYIQEQRCQLAADLILNSNRAIKEIAASCGFESVHYFTRVFTVKLGVAPAKFRRSQFSEGRSGSLSFPDAPSMQSQNQSPDQK